jgi:hypothetical protein
MAEGFLCDMAGDRYEALSAGVEPHGLNPLAVEVMREIGIDISCNPTLPRAGLRTTPQTSTMDGTPSQVLLKLLDLTIVRHFRYTLNRGGYHLLLFQVP